MSCWPTSCCPSYVSQVLPNGHWNHTFKPDNGIEDASKQIMRPAPGNPIMASRLDLSSVSAAQQGVAQRAASTQAHSHTATCQKGFRTGDDTDCRMGMPRPAVLDSHVDPITGLVNVRRLSTMAVPYLPPLMMTDYACNHAIYLSCDGSRYAAIHGPS